MTKFMRGATFEKYFKAQVPNFKEFKISFEHKRGHETLIKFPHKGRVCYIRLYRCDWGLNPWIGHFIAFFKTGKFDSHSYWDVYTSDSMTLDKFYKGEYHKVKMILAHDGEWCVHSVEHSNHMIKYRKEHGDSGFTQIGKVV